MDFRLIKTWVSRLNLTDIPKETTLQHGQVQVKHSTAWHTTSLRDFAIIFNLDLALHEGALVTVEFYAAFSTEADITEEFKESHFPNVNAPAVAYPFLRAFVAQFAALAGFNSFFLPVRNFTEPKAPEETEAPKELTVSDSAPPSSPATSQAASSP